MTNQISTSGPITLDVPSMDTFKRNFRICTESIKEGQNKVNQLEAVLILSIPVSAVFTAVLPILYPGPTTRFSCAAVTFLCLAAFLVYRSSILRTIPRRHVYLLLGMLGATFMLGLALALLLSEAIQLLHA